MDPLAPRVKLSIALALQRGHGTPINLCSILHRQERVHHGKGRIPYAHLSRLGKTFVTANYNEHLDEGLEPPSLAVGGDIDTSKKGSVKW
jgi:hypothetical protein